MPGGSRETPEALVREQGAFASIGRPRDWAVLEDQDTVFVVAAPESTGFRAHVVITRLPFTGSTEKLSTTVLTYAHTLLDDVFFIAVERLSADRGEGRIIEYTHNAAGTSVHRRVVVLNTADQAVTVTASCASAELSAFDDLLELVCSSVQLREYQ